MFALLPINIYKYSSIKRDTEFILFAMKTKLNLFRKHTAFENAKTEPFNLCL